MNDLPADVAATLAKGVAAYVRATATAELPPSLAPLKKTAQTQKGLARHRAQLLAVLEDEALRALVLEWLEESKPSLSRDEVATLKLAAERPEGWKDRLTDASKKKKGAPRPDLSPKLKDLQDKLAREKEAHRRTKEEVRTAKEDGLNKIRMERARSLRLDEEVTALRDSERDWKGEASAQTKRADRLEKTLERERRKTRTDLESLREQVKQLRGEKRDLATRLAEVEKAAKPAPPAPKPKRATKPVPGKAAPRGPRSRLKAPKGRLEDDPETLDEWLDTEEVALVVDGYNVTRSPSGFGQLGLEQQRSRLREMLKTFSNRRRVQVVLVWDGGEVAPGTKRMSTRYLTEEYSEPDRSGTGEDKDRADRHIIALLKKMPLHPVVLATNDRALQDAARAQRATIATSDQLLALLR